MIYCLRYLVVLSRGVMGCPLLPPEAAAFYCSFRRDMVECGRKGVWRLPNFNDFLLFLDQNKIENILSDAQLKAKEVQFLDSPNGIGNQIAVLSFTISLEVVGLYHAWLEQAQE